MSIFFQDCPLYYINLKDRKDRDDLFISQMKDLDIKNYKRINASTIEDVSYKIIQDFMSYGCTPSEAATTVSHLIAIKYFLENSNSEYAVICEDDADLSNSNNLTFAIFDLFKYSNNVQCFQLGISTREDIDPNFSMHRITPWDFNSSTYTLTKKYAQEIVSKFFINNAISLDNFVQSDIFDYRNSSWIKSSPVSEYVVYDRDKTVTCPIFTFTISKSSVQISDEHFRQNIKSRNDFLEYWSKFDSIDYEDLLAKNSSFFSDSLLNNLISNKKISLVIPWRPTNSRIEIFDYLINWYSTEFPEINIVLSDSDHEKFNLSASRNKGILKAINDGAELILSSDADFFPSKDVLTRAIYNSLNTDRISVPYNDYIELTYEGTQKFLKNDKSCMHMYNKRNFNPRLVNGKTDRLWVCSGLLAITKEKFLELGQFDENYIGWGQEDIDYHKRYLDKYARLFDYIDGIGLSLEHSRDEWKNNSNQNIEYFKSKYGEEYIF